MMGKFIKGILSFLNIKAYIKSDSKHLYRKVLKAFMCSFTVICN